MHAVIGQVKIDPARDDEAQQLLLDFVLPTVKEQAGFQRGLWARSVDGDVGYSITLYDTEENARAAATGMAEGPPPGAPVSFSSAAVCEVRAEA